MQGPGRIRIGISGWNYKPWRGVFYPAKLAHKRELEYAASTFQSIEINGTFYSLQRPSSFERWVKETPEDFVFAVKGSRFITHMLRLRNVEVPLANFLASGLLKLGPKLGPILWQFPPNFQFDPQTLDAFFRLLPKDTTEAAILARGHDARLKVRAFTEAEVNQPLRYAMEIRHDSFVSPEFISLLRKYQVALVCADTVEWPLLMDVTSDFVYCRLHGSKELYASGYGPKALDRWASRVTAWAQGQEVEDGKRASAEGAPALASRDVYVYFDNDAKVRAPADAKGLIRRVKALTKSSTLAAATTAL